MHALLLAVFLAVLPPGGSFVDDDGNVHEGGIEAIAAEGITRGCNPPANDRFCPDRTVTRGQMAVFLARALDLGSTPNDYFVDDETSTIRSWDQSSPRCRDNPGLQPPGQQPVLPGTEHDPGRDGRDAGQSLQLSGVTTTTGSPTTTATSSNKQSKRSLPPE